MTDYEKLKALLHDTPFITVDIAQGTAHFAGEGTVFQSLLRDNPMDCSRATINAGSALAGFAALSGVGRADKTFGVNDVAKAAGMDRGLTHNYVQRGILRPSVQPRSGMGRGKDLLFSWYDLYVAGVVGCFRRQGLVPYLLQQVADLFYQDETQQKRTASKRQLASRP